MTLMCKPISQLFSLWLQLSLSARLLTVPSVTLLPSCPLCLSTHCNPTAITAALERVSQKVSDDLIAEHIHLNLVLKI